MMSTAEMVSNIKVLTSILKDGMENTDTKIKAAQEMLRMECVVNPETPFDQRANAILLEVLSEIQNDPMNTGAERVRATNLLITLETRRN